MGFHIRIYTERLVLKHQWRISRQADAFKDNVFIEIERDGIVGLGEAAHNPRYNESLDSTRGFLQAATPVLEKCHPSHFRHVIDEINKLGPGQGAAKACVEMALLDWITKRVGWPLSRYFGVDEKRMLQTSFSIGLDEPEIIRKKVREAREYPILKIKLGTEHDNEIIHAVRSETDKKVRVDANEGWKDKELALDRIRWLSGLNVEFVEQPMPADRPDDMKWLRQRAPLPLFADEAVKDSRDIPALVGSYDGINIKIDKSGGLLEALRMISLARACHLSVMIGCMVASSLSITAAAHLVPLADYADLDGNLLLQNDLFDGVKVENGWLRLSKRIGLGVEKKPRH
jgi:L-alanine-DL-glutamate epimerase-like enolase superfamily enzyme